MPKALHID